MENRRIGYIFILIAASLWGTLGVFYKYIQMYAALSPLEIVFWRAFVAATFTISITAIWKRNELKINRSHFPIFLAIGFIGIAGFYIVYIYAITMIGIGMASVLLYSAPLWVALYGFLLQGEQITAQKIYALILALAGILLITGVFRNNQSQISITGLLAGIGSGIGYAAYILLNKKASQLGYTTWTVNAYGLGLGSIFLLFFQSPGSLHLTLSSPSTLILLFLLGLLPTLGGGLAFYAGLQRISAVNASIVATFEPVVATSLGWLFFSEALSLVQILGGLLILSAVILIQLPAINYQTTINSPPFDKE